MRSSKSAKKVQGSVSTLGDPDVETSKPPSTGPSTGPDTGTGPGTGPGAGSGARTGPGSGTGKVSPPDVSEVTSELTNSDLDGSHAEIHGPETGKPRETLTSRDVDSVSPGQPTQVQTLDPRIKSRLGLPVRQSPQPQVLPTRDDAGDGGDNRTGRHQRKVAIHLRKTRF